MSGALGQNSGALSGKVTGSSGSAVSNASVLVTDSTGFARNAVTGQEGEFTINNLPPGTYRVEVQVPGFKRLTQENVQIAAGTPVNLQLRLEGGSDQDSVTVAANAPLADDASAQVAHSYAGRVLSELPVQDINHTQLSEVTTGVTPPTVTPNILVDPQRNRTWNTNGQPTQANNYLHDGVENQEAVANMEAHVVTMNGIQQMNLSTSNYDAEQGRAAGSILMPISKPGATSFHGELFEYHSNDWLRARNYFNPSPLPQGVYVSNQFGGNVGGAIRPDHTFFFVSEQTDWVRDSNPVFATVPTAPFASGNFSSLPFVTIYNPFTGFANGAGRTAFTNNTIPSNLISPTATAILAQVPAPNLTGPFNNYYTNQIFRNRGSRVDARLDQRFSDRNLLFLRYGLSYYDTTQDAALGPISSDGGSSRLRGHDALIGYAHSFGPTTFTDIRAGYIRYSNPISPLPGVGSGSSFGFIGSTGGIPSIAIDGMPTLGTNPTYPQINKEDNWNIVNNWTFRIHNNDLRFGADAYWIRADGFQNMLYGPSGAYSFTAGATSTPGVALGPAATYANSLAAFLLGTPTTSGITTNTFLPSYISRQYSAYVADRVNILSHLTLDIGLRYDYFWPLQPRSNAASYFTYDPIANTLNSLGSGSRSGGVHGNNANLSPRIGIAYRLRDRTVVRAGYAMSYFSPGIAFQSSVLNPYMTTAAVGVSGSYAVAGQLGTFPSVLPNGIAPNQALYVTQSQVRTPYVQSFNFDVQQDVTHGILFDIAYVGNLGRDLPFTQDLNAALPGTGTAGQAFAAGGQTAPVLLRGTGFNSNYNSLQANATKRFSGGLAFTAAYTFSKSLDYGAGLQPFLNNNNPFANYGLSNFDRTHIFTLTHNWRLPFGAGTAHFNSGVLAHILGPWELDGILRTATGQPFTPTASAAVCQCPGNTATADVTPGPTLSGVSVFPGFFGSFAFPVAIPTIQFTQPAAGSFGNIGRNAVRGPGFTNYDLALSRSFVFHEGTWVDFRAEAYNITNSPHFGMPITNVNSVNFGLSNKTAPGLDSRLFQAVVKFVF
ncbi:MAG TPA: TonB-dependent receptor [Bryobacteraceae bacterium]|nr:TonB-dependent receptor [Bryobacteraceae bacterium]